MGEESPREEEGTRESERESSDSEEEWRRHSSEITEEESSDNNIVRACFTRMIRVKRRELRMLQRQLAERRRNREYDSDTD